MNVTIQDYAKTKGVSAQAVYNAIKKNGINTIKGVNNGKATQFLDDYSQEILDQAMKPTQKSSEILVAQMNLEIANRETALLREKAREVEETRIQMLEQIQSIGDSISANVDKKIESSLVEELRKQINELTNQRIEESKTYAVKVNDFLREIDFYSKENQKMKEKISTDKEHPWKHLWRCLTRKE